MFETIIRILSKTPWKVYAIFAYLLYVGVKSARKQVISIKKIAILSIALFVFSIKSLESIWSTHSSIAYMWLFSIVVGITIGYINLVNKEILIDKIEKKVQIPGSYSVIFIIMIVFTSRYIMGFMAATNQEVISHSYYIFFKVFFSSLPAGVLLGRLIYILKGYLDRNTKQIKKTNTTSNL